MVVFSSPEIKQGETYTIYVNDNESGSQEQTSVVTSNVSGGMNGGMMQGGGMQRENFQGQNINQGENQMNGQGGMRQGKGQMIR